MQPWNFLLIRDPQRRKQIHDHFKDVSAQAAEQYDDDRQDQYLSLKLQGILDAPLNVLITCDTQRGGQNVLGRYTIPETDVYSTCLAVQNFWLAARAEGVGVGWMSIMENDVIRGLLQIPDHIVPIAYLTVGYPIAFPQTPMLERVGWRRRENLRELVFTEVWDGPPPAGPIVPEPPTAPRPDLSPSPDAIRRNQDLTKPPGSLGQLEDVALKICGIQGRLHPRLQERWLLLLASDHGVTAEGVSAYRPAVTARMVYQFIAGAAAVSAIARQEGVQVQIADLGVDHDFGEATGLAHHKVRRGTRNFAQEPAMTAAELEQALDAGRQLVHQLPNPDILALGEMGIGNSSSAAAITAALLDRSPEEVVGIGTGIGARTKARKRAVVSQALTRHGTHLDGPDAVLQHLGGFEIAGLVGVIEAAAERGIPIVLDGFITSAAALAAVRRNPRTAPYLIAGHRSAEPGHSLILEALGLKPLLQLDMRLGEGSGAVLAVGLIASACRVMTDMVTFEEAGIEHPLAPGGRT
jgi:nicotinate-nucleotide--dimethylbenzimidazole phosphoribosyltransferase